MFWPKMNLWIYLIDVPHWPIAKTSKTLQLYKNLQYREIHFEMAAVNKFWADYIQAKNVEGFKYAIRVCINRLWLQLKYCFISNNHISAYFLCFQMILAEPFVETNWNSKLRWYYKYKGQVFRWNWSIELFHNSGSFK